MTAHKPRRRFRISCARGVEQSATLRAPRRFPGEVVQTASASV
jgi:hypothetical protein